MEKQLQSTDPQPIEPAAYQQLIATIGQTLEAGRVRAYRVAEQISVQTRWEIGRHIVEYEQKGNEQAEYGAFLLDRLARDLILAYGQGFRRTSVFFIRKLYLFFQKVQTLSELLSWSHYCELLLIDDRALLEQKIRLILEEESANDKNTAL